MDEVVYYRFKSAKIINSLPIGNNVVSVWRLKNLIFDKHFKNDKKAVKYRDFDISVANAQTDEDYVDDDAPIFKHTSLVVRRVPRLHMEPIVVEPEKTKALEEIEKADKVPSLVSASSSHSGESQWDEIVKELSSVSEVLPGEEDVSVKSRAEEDKKIKDLVEAPTMEGWNFHGQNIPGGERAYVRGFGANVISAPGYGCNRFGKMTPPSGYVCHRCRVPGHFIQHCPTNGDPDYDIKRRNQPTGIQLSMLIETPDGSYALANGGTAVLKPNQAPFTKEIEGLPSTRQLGVPPELRCPLCKEVMKDAVLTGKCCFRSFCDKCIREYIIENKKCACGAINIISDNLVPNRTLRDTISCTLWSAASSPANVRLACVPDVESGNNTQTKSTLESVTATSNGEPVGPPIDHPSDLKTENAQLGEDACEGMVVVSGSSEDPKASEATPLSTVVQGGESSEITQIPEELPKKLVGVEEGKRKKKTKHLPKNGVDMGVEAYARVPLPPSTFYSCGYGGRPLGIGGYPEPPFLSFPMSGYSTGHIPPSFSQMLPEDPFAAQYHMLSATLPRDLSELAPKNMGINQGHLISRNVFEDQDVGLRRQYENVQNDERKHSRNNGRFDKETASRGADDSSRSSQAPSRHQPNGGGHAERTTDRDSGRSTEVKRHDHHSPANRGALCAPSSVGDETERSSKKRRLEDCEDDRRRSHRASSRGHKRTREEDDEEHYSRRHSRLSSRKGDERWASSRRRD